MREAVENAEDSFMLALTNAQALEKSILDTECVGG